MFARTGNFDKLLEKATSHLLMDPDWVSTLQICDLIRQNDVQPRYALAALKKKLTSTNPHSAYYALLVVESMVKNCGPVVHEELTAKAFCDFLHDLAKTTVHENVRTKLLELIQAWNFAFRKNPKHGALKDLMAAMKAEGYKFPVLRESDAMFAADTAPEWADGDVCHRCRVQFNIIQRKHHCRACGQVFCGQCTSRSTTLPKYGIEKEVRVCDSCFEQATKPSTTKPSKADTELPPEYLKSSLAQQSQVLLCSQEPPKKSEEELREEEELQLALALSQSEAEAKEKEKHKGPTSILSYKAPTEAVTERPVTPREEATASSNPELDRYLNRSYWESLHSSGGGTTSDDQKGAPASPSAPMAANEVSYSVHTVADVDLEEFIKTLKSQVEIFINRMKSDSSRGRSIANDTSVQTLFMTITAMHSRLLTHIHEHDDARVHFERLQDKLTQVKDARAALDALREEHRDKLRREAEEAERQRQMQMAHKLEVMRKKKQEYLQYQRQLALQRIQEQEREMQMRQEQQKQQYYLPAGPVTATAQYGSYMGSPVHAGTAPQQFVPPNSAPPVGAGYHSFPYPQHMMQPPQSAPPQMSGQQGSLNSQSLPHQMPGAPPGFPQGASHTQLPTNPQFQQAMMGQHGIPPPPGSHHGMPTPSNQHQMPPGQGMPSGQQGMPPNQQAMPQRMPQMVQGPPAMGVPPQGGIPQPQAVPQAQIPGQVPGQFQQPGPPQPKEEAQTAELISFD
ncbi:unnamed protein product [Acanthoscelides obtectus]|uniref:Hepatocyte growth factor-regulated tyrosine kinase substrate n=1 Tax=Acanthoscelides obtectus TaxID=200917 RepID=A0A9P0PR33_ACAOB|nr:unnamed protein product [Acanthoscelides obtectus]CAK1671047.1 Hepatocyte growth factor-regulated tyrosine kinase substrate [Acanthoscelides obtectus]